MGEVAYLTKESIIGAQDITEEDIYVAEWGGTVRIKSFTVKQQRSLFEATKDPVTGKTDEKRAQVAMFIHGVVNPKFDAADEAALSEKSAGAVNRILNRILEISGMTSEVQETAEKSFRNGQPKEV